MKSLFEENLPKSSFGTIARFLEPGAASIIICSACIFFVFNSDGLLNTALLIKLFNRMAFKQWDLVGLKPIKSEP